MLLGAWARPAFPVRCQDSWEHIRDGTHACPRKPVQLCVPAPLLTPKASPFFLRRVIPCPFLHLLNYKQLHISQLVISVPPRAQGLLGMIIKTQRFYSRNFQIVLQSISWICPCVSITTAKIGIQVFIAPNSLALFLLRSLLTLLHTTSRFIFLEHSCPVIPLLTNALSIKP